MSSTETVSSSIGNQVQIIRCRKPDHVLCGPVLGLLIGPICGFQSFRWLSGRRIVEEMSPALGGTRCEPSVSLCSALLSGIGYMGGSPLTIGRLAMPYGWCHTKPKISLDRAEV